MSFFADLDVAQVMEDFKARRIARGIADELIAVKSLVAARQRCALLLLAAAAYLSGCQSMIAFPNASLAEDDAPQRISALLVKPEGAGPHPAVVLLHTCGGMQAHVSNEWPLYLRGLGYVVLTVDSFGSRGLGPCGNSLRPATVGPKTAAYREITRDAYGALDYLAAQPYVRQERVAVVGFPLGANVINSYLIHMPRPSGPAFAAAVGIYGRCHDIYRFPMPRTPLLEIAGELDAAHVVHCRALRAPIEVRVLKGAYHSWDNGQASGKTNPYGDVNRYDGAATAESREHVRAFLARHLAP